ncbi:cobalamin biosynthesis protein CobG [Sedimentitalea todarodis]|uniref:Cobalamin biosynthesis protein CobG n=1 Tax=Sedimentitalea todarodis TaxID=1631240 RepID=A0ABU3VI57_9RHOB|nr:cobalamin biosynthesis protein CobG [Sedimentitalea todarodis]MDU9005695.1 cobalamin biosynthesis protein CobG [Sedimentitalea todarodis]
MIPEVKGWCPGAYRPMMSGDGLVVRVRPRLARLTARQALGLCTAAARRGNGTIDLTNRANLQLRGVVEADHAALLEELAALGVLDADPALEMRRNILMTPLYDAGDLTERLAQHLTDRLADLPDLPAKFGFAIDTGLTRMLCGCSADIRLERGDRGLILRADGAATGRRVTEADAIDQMIALAMWFAATRDPQTRRMARLIEERELPEAWRGAEPGPVTPPCHPGACDAGMIYGAPFGQLDAEALAALIRQTNATALRVTPWRMFVLEGATGSDIGAFITTPGDPLLAIDACPGAPYCPQAQAETRATARELAPRVRGSLHVSGCAKGCARNTPADITLVGRDGRFDLVKHGCAGDEPTMRALTATDLLRLGDLT